MSMFNFSRVVQLFWNSDPPNTDYKSPIVCLGNIYFSDIDNSLKDTNNNDTEKFESYENIPSDINIEKYPNGVEMEDGFSKVENDLINKDANNVINNKSTNTSHSNIDNEDNDINLSNISSDNDLKSKIPSAFSFANNIKLNISNLKNTINSSTNNNNNNNNNNENENENHSKGTNFSSENTPINQNSVTQNLNSWPKDFINDIDARFWFTYRTDFSVILSSSEGPSPVNVKNIIRGQLKDLSGFTSDVGWGCMIRSGQTLLANALSLLLLTREWRRGQNSIMENKILSWFADNTQAVASIHQFIKYGKIYGKHPGEWFGPSATARCIQKICTDFQPPLLNVYVAGDSGDIYEKELLKEASKPFSNNNHEKSENSEKTLTTNDGKIFNPTLILVGLRLGIEGVNPLYWDSLKDFFKIPQFVGIAGGRPSSSHYFFAYQSDNLFFLDPHYPRPMLPLKSDLNYTKDEIDSVHTRRIRMIHLNEMDPSMLLGFLVRDRDDWESLKKSIESAQGRKIIHIIDTLPCFSRRGSTKDGFVDLGDIFGDEEEDDSSNNSKKNAINTNGDINDNIQQNIVDNKTGTLTDLVNNSNKIMITNDIKIKKQSNYDEQESQTFNSFYNCQITPGLASTFESLTNIRSVKDSYDGFDDMYSDFKLRNDLLDDPEVLGSSLEAEPVAIELSASLTNSVLDDKSSINEEPIAVAADECMWPISDIDTSVDSPKSGHGSNSKHEYDSTTKLGSSTKYSTMHYSLSKIASERSTAGTVISSTT